MIGRIRARSNDRGFTLTEVLVTMVILLVLGTVAIKAFASQNRSTNVTAARSTATSQLQDASTALTRDVADAQVIEVADSTQLKLLVVRNDLCNERTYTVASGEFQVQTAFYAQATCAGPTTSRTVNLVDQFTVTAPFSYIDTNLVTLTTPVSEIRGITAVQWHLARSVAGTTNGVSRDAAQPYQGKNLAAGNGQQAARALAPVLSVTTNNTGMEGRDQPQITWVDQSPTVTTGWNVYRAAWPEGGTQASWALLSTILDKTVSSFTDNSLPAGWTAQYEVQPTVAGGTETPTSNVVTTGLRPAAPTGVTATGQPTSILINWAQDPGATSYDVYRDGALYAHAGNVLSFTDSTGYGHSHVYNVVGWSRWEALVLGGTQTATASIGDATTKTYRMSTARLVSAPVGAYTAPAAPTVTLTANSDWSNTLTWAAAGWTGAGPTTVGGVNRDRGWTGDVNSSNTSSPTGTWSALWGGAEAAPSTPSRTDAYTQAAVAGQWRNYRVTTCNPVGCSPTSAVQNVLQRAINPGACTAVLGGITTRQATVTVARPALVSPYTNTEVTGGTPAAGYGVAGIGQANTTSFAIDNLAHSTTHTFTVRNQNGSAANGGWSDTSTCQVTTAVLGVSITSVSSTTRSITAAGSSTNGTSQNLTLEGVSTQNGLGSYTWDPLSESTGFTITARNTDGVNGVVAQQGVNTANPPSPSDIAPSCSATVTNSLAPGAIAISGGTYARAYSGGTWYSSPTTVGGLSAGTYYPQTENIWSDGYNPSVYSYATCSGKTITGPPATPSGFTSATQNRVWTNGPPSGELGIEVYTYWSAVPNATQYQVRYTYTDSSSGLPVTNTYTVTGTSDYEFFNNQNAVIGSAQVSLRAGNASGWSGWTSVSIPSTTGQVTY